MMDVGNQRGGADSGLARQKALVVSGLGGSVRGVPNPGKHRGPRDKWMVFLP